MRRKGLAAVSVVATLALTAVIAACGGGSNRGLPARRDELAWAGLAVVRVGPWRGVDAD